MELLRQLAQNYPVIFAIGEVGIGAGILALAFKVVEYLSKLVLAYLIVCQRTTYRLPGSVLISYLNRNCRHFGVNDELFHASRQYVRPVEGDMIVFYRKLTQSFRLFLYRRAPILMSPGKRMNEEVPPDGAHIQFRYLRWTVDWNELLRKAVQEYDQYNKEDETKNGRRGFVVIKHSGDPDTSIEGVPLRARNEDNEDSEPINWRVEDIGPPAPEKPLNHLSLGKVAQAIVRDVKFWYSHRDWYRERGLSWRRGYNLYGRPGTGKTSIIRAMAEELDIPVHTFGLASMSNYDFENSWKRTQNDCPRIVLFEDFDNIFDGRKNREEDTGLTFDCILNAIDGIERQDGLLLFITSNHIDKIDPALGVPDADGNSTRPGRIDVVAELPGLDFEGRLKMANRILLDCPDEAQKLALSEPDGITAAQFQEKAARKARELLWQGEGFATD